MQALSQLSYTPTKGAHYTDRISLCKEWEMALFDCKENARSFPNGRRLLASDICFLDKPPGKRFLSSAQLLSQRQVADTLAGRREHCIDECRGERWKSRFSDPAGGVIDRGSDDVRPNVHRALTYA